MFHSWLMGAVLVAMGLCAGGLTARAAEPDVTGRTTDQGDIRIVSFLPVAPTNRARRAAKLEAVIENLGDAPVKVTVELVLPKGAEPLLAEPRAAVEVPDHEARSVARAVRVEKPGTYEFGLRVVRDGKTVGTASLPLLFLPHRELRTLAYIPEPRPAKTSLLIGAHHCPLWEADEPHMWNNVLRHPERTPALGFYAQANPEVADWETKWAVEHGVSFFVYCWYRASKGDAVETRYSSAIHEALFKSRFANRIKFAIMWENQARPTDWGEGGVRDERDLKQNLFPFWMKNYFRHPSYLKVDNKPVLFIYEPLKLIRELGGIENVAKALDWMRQECRREGFAGLYVLGEYRGLDPNRLRRMKQVGLDYTFAYCWHVPNSPTPQQAIHAQMNSIRKTQELGILPQVVTVSQAWSGWNDEGSIWKIPPRDFKTLLGRARDFIAAFPPDQLGGRMLLLDNWNEWGEGHYIAPCREYGFGYLDAVRDVLADAKGPHEDLVPEDIGMGPYDTAYKAHAKRQRELRAMASRKILKAGAARKGLIGWWAFDEDAGDPIALDSSGRRLGGAFHGATRDKGIDGSALVCEGGCVLVDSSDKLSVTDAFAIECWVRTDLAGQDNMWFVNRVFGGGENTGYRMGVLGGKPCFEVPLTNWSHHLQASADLPTGRWVHLAGTFDGKTMRIYVDGQQQGTMHRPGPAKPNKFHLCLGNYELRHEAHFTGLLDEVRLYDRALTAEEVKAHYHELAGAAGK